MRKNFTEPCSAKHGRRKVHPEIRAGRLKIGGNRTGRLRIGGNRTGRLRIDGNLTGRIRTGGMTALHLQLMVRVKVRIPSLSETGDPPL